ncbi:adventurous gliding motility protein GltC [Vulgatibacter sp.]|uniref:adventurous gliding motility protein GltC n=1 Tax=Vulgatibacter sp. TaxID=1971226 RepID=UPI00356AD554
MRTSILSLALSFALGTSLVGLPAQANAQISFEGLDLSDPVEEKKPAAPAPKKKKAQPKRKVAPKRATKQVTPPALPAAAQTRPAAEKPAPTMSFDGFDVTGKTADRQKLDAAVSLFKEENYEAAALGFQEILNDAQAIEQHQQAEYLLAKSLYRMGLYHSSLTVFQRILARGEAHKYFSTSLEWLFFISHKTTGQSVVLDEIARYAGAEWPEKYRTEFRYLLAKYNFVRGKALLDAASAAAEKDRAGHTAEAKKSFSEARRLLAMVPRDSRFHPKARYLDGLTLYVEGQFQPAVEAFKDVVRALNPKTGQQQDPALREQAFMQLARIHYEHKQNRYAIFYYGRVARGGDQWLQSLYESSWSNFRLGEYERALGNMITLHSPFFQDEYFPEALILKAVIYYENCRYPEATQIVEEFNRTYLPLYHELERVLSGNLLTPQDYYDVLADIQKANRTEAGETSKMLERILKLALSDRELKHLNDSILELEAEADAIGGKRDLFRFSDLAKTLIQDLEAQRVEVQKKAGFYAKRKLERERRELAQLNYRALAIKAEIGTSEKDALEASLAEGQNVTVVKQYRYSTAVDDEHVYWPYEGEYWRDELGTYQYTLTKGCKDNR